MQIKRLDVNIDFCFAFVERLKRVVVPLCELQPSLAGLLLL